MSNLKKKKSESIKIIVGNYLLTSPTKFILCPHSEAPTLVISSSYLGCTMHHMSLEERFQSGESETNVDAING